ncbi:MAG: hypothetical protein HYY18_05935 [Planctomycetes bacterium]|nr:hypothetical protein [Planctomycetota bacterium]
MRITKRAKGEASGNGAELPADWGDHVAEILFEEAAREGGVLPWPEEGAGEPAPYLRPVVP